MHSVILYYVVQAQAAERHRQAQREAPARTAHRAHAPGTGRGPPPGPASRELAVNRTGYLDGCLAGLGRWAGVLPSYCGAVAAALAGARPDPPWWLYHRLHLPPRARAHPVVSGGMPGWQITLLVGAALLAAAIAVTVYRRRARRRTAARTAWPAAGQAEHTHPTEPSKWKPS